MRLWSVHPQYLDAKGLVALWREALLAKRVLEGKTRGYKNHPQLIRFKNTKHPALAVSQYLSEILKEAKKRKYCFDAEKIDKKFKPVKLSVTQGQVNFEFLHLLKKLKIRDTERFQRIENELRVKPHPMFKIIKGDVASWEIREE